MFFLLLMEGSLVNKTNLQALAEPTVTRPVPDPPSCVKPQQPTIHPSKGTTYSTSLITQTLLTICYYLYNHPNNHYIHHNKPGGRTFFTK